MYETLWPVSQWSVNRPTQVTGRYIGPSILPSSDRLQGFTIVKSAVPRVFFEGIKSWNGTFSQVVSSGKILLHSILSAIKFFAFTITIKSLSSWFDPAILLNYRYTAGNEPPQSPLATMSHSGSVKLQFANRQRYRNIEGPTRCKLPTHYPGVYLFFYESILSGFRFPCFSITYYLFIKLVQCPCFCRTRDMATAFLCGIRRRRKRQWSVCGLY